MDHADDGNDVYIYMGGDQEVPWDVTHVRIHKSVKIIRREVFSGCEDLVSIEMHDGVEIIEEDAFWDCWSLRGIKLTGVRVIGESAFQYCRNLVDVKFGDKLEIIGGSAFFGTSLRNVKLRKVRTIGSHAFSGCEQLIDVELSKDLERIGYGAFNYCPRLRRIAMPLKDDMFDEDGRVFHLCDDLSQVDLVGVGGIHKTISSLLLDSWRNDMNDEIDSINRVLPNTPDNEKTTAIHRWSWRILRRIEHYKSEHYTLLKEFTTLLELALWGVNLQQQEERLWLKWVDNKQPAKKAKIDIDAVRHEARITSGASVVIKNVLPFLKLE